jgi:hypothetical protein
LLNEGKSKQLLLNNWQLNPPVNLFFKTLSPCSAFVHLGVSFIQKGYICPWKRKWEGIMQKTKIWSKWPLSLIGKAVIA